MDQDQTACKKCGALVNRAFAICNFCGEFLEEFQKLSTPDLSQVKLIYNAAVAASLGAKRALETGGEVSYPVYVHEYNRLAVQTLHQFGQQPSMPLHVITLRKAVNPHDALPIEWRLFLETASLELNKLVVYLESRLEPQQRLINQSIEELKIHINNNLRASFHTDPQNETEVQDELETILRAGGFDLVRHKVSIPVGAKVYKPDFTLKSMDLALEVKFCNESRNISEMIDEMNADIIGYQSDFANTLFVVYDMGIIRDVNEFIAGFEIPHVQVLIVKK